MKISMLKQSGGVLLPANDGEAEALTKFKTGEVYEIEIRRVRNPAFHRKTFAFFNFCFAHWRSDREFMDEKGQFDVFRKHLTVLAGFYDSYFKLDGAVRVEAKSISYGSMAPDEFEQHYRALVAAAMRTIFQGCSQATENQLMGFFA